MIVKDRGSGKCFACGADLGPDGKGEDYAAIGNKYEQTTRFSNESTVVPGPDGSKKYGVRTETQTRIILAAKTSGRMCDACHELYHHNELVSRRRSSLLIIGLLFACFMYLWHSPGFLSELISPDGFFSSCVKAVLFAAQSLILVFGVMAVFFVPLMSTGLLISLFSKEERRVDGAKYLVAFLRKEEPSLNAKAIEDGTKHLAEYLDSRGIRDGYARETFIASIFDDNAARQEAEGYKKIGREYKARVVYLPLTSANYGFFKADDEAVESWKDAEDCDIDMRRKSWASVVKVGILVSILAAGLLILGARFGNGGEAIFELFRKS